MYEITNITVFTINNSCTY